MDPLVIFAASEGAAIAVADGILGSIETLIEADGRSNPTPRSRKFSIRQSQFPIAEQDSRFDERWYRDQFRCTKSSFDTISQLVKSEWLVVNDPINFNAFFFIRNRVAFTLYNLMHSGSIAEDAKHFGMSKSSASRFIWQSGN